MDPNWVLMYLDAGGNVCKLLGWNKASGRQRIDSIEDDKTKPQINELQPQCGTSSINNNIEQVFPRNLKQAASHQLTAAGCIACKTSKSEPP